MQPNIGDVLEGKITSITKFGAFVALPDGKNGLVHISEIANAFVSDVHEHVTEGQTVKVKVIGINEQGKINLSIKQALPPAPRTEAPRPHQQAQKSAPSMRQVEQAAPQTADQVFEDKLKRFMQDSDSRISDSRTYSDRKGSYRRRRD
jgi:S1 RNA binding domain protein